MRIAECAHPSRYFLTSVSAKITTFFILWLPVADIGGTHDSVSSIVKTGYKARYKAKVCHLK